MKNFGKIVKNENFELFWENFELFLGKLWTFWENFELFGKILNFLGKFWTFWENFDLFGDFLFAEFFLYFLPSLPANIPVMESEDVRPLDPLDVRMGECGTCSRLELETFLEVLVVVGVL